MGHVVDHSSPSNGSGWRLHLGVLALVLVGGIPNVLLAIVRLVWPPPGFLGWTRFLGSAFILSTALPPLLHWAVATIWLRWGSSWETSQVVAVHLRLVAIYTIVFGLCVFLGIIR